MDGNPEFRIDSPLEIFPKEVWELILDRVDSEPDIATALEALPELHCLEHCKQLDWRISELLPLLVPKYLNIPEIRCCRLVNKRWNYAINLALTLHPSNFTSGEIITSTHFNYQPLPLYAPSFGRMLASNDDDSWILPDPSWNPFVGHSLQIASKDISPPRKNAALYSLQQAAPLLLLHGGNLHHLSISLGPVSDLLTKPVLRLLFSCLASLPHLRSLRLAGTFAPSHVTLSPPKSLPFSLTSLDLSSLDIEETLLTSTLPKFLTSHHPPSHLTLHLDYWTATYLAMFPSITSLLLHLREYTPKKHDLANLASLPHLRSLQISNYCPHAHFTVNQLLLHFTPLHLTSLSIVDAHSNPYIRPRDPPNLPLPPLLPSISSLTLSDGLVTTYDFLHSLPSLQFLTLSVDQPLRSRLLPDYSPSFTNSLRAFFHGAYISPSKFPLWKVLPSLQVLTVSSKEGVILHQFCRECPVKVFTPGVPNLAGEGPDEIDMETRVQIKLEALELIKARLMNEGLKMCFSNVVKNPLIQQLCQDNAPLRKLCEKVHHGEMQLGE